MVLSTPSLVHPVELVARSFSRRSQLPLLPNQLWRIEAGVVRTYTWLDDGCLATIGVWGMGDILGSPFSSGANPYHAECLSDVKVVPLAPDQWHLVSDAMMEHIRQSVTLLEILHCPQTEIALLRALNWLAQRFGYESQQGRKITVRLTHQELAELIGSTRVTVTRMLSDLEKRGLIQRQQRSITVKLESNPFWHYTI